MKKLILLSTLFIAGVMGAASAANVTVYYSPTCPHCHNARNFIEETLVYEYPSIKVTTVNVMNQENHPMFRAALEKCEYESGGVPVIVIGEKCFQGYADFMQADLRQAVEADMDDAQKQVAAENKKAMEENAEQFKADHASRADAVSEYGAATAAADGKKSTVWFYALLVILVAGLGFVLIKKNKK